MSESVHRNYKNDIFSIDTTLSRESLYRMKYLIALHNNGTYDIKLPPLGPMMYLLSLFCVLTSALSEHPPSSTYILIVAPCGSPRIYISFAYQQLVAHVLSLYPERCCNSSACSDIGRPNMGKFQNVDEMIKIMLVVGVPQKSDMLIEEYFISIITGKLYGWRQC